MSWFRVCIVLQGLLLMRGDSSVLKTFTLRSELTPVIFNSLFRVYMFRSLRTWCGLCGSCPGCEVHGLRCIVPKCLIVSLCTRIKLIGCYLLANFTLSLDLAR